MGIDRDDVQLLAAVLGYISDAVFAGSSVKRSIENLNLALSEEDPKQGVINLKISEKARLDRAQEEAAKLRGSD